MTKTTELSEKNPIIKILTLALVILDHNHLIIIQMEIVENDHSHVTAFKM